MKIKQSVLDLFVLACVCLFVAGGCTTTKTLSTTPVTGKTIVDEDKKPGKTAAEINVQLGLEYMRQDNLPAALEKLEKAVKQDPKLPSAHNSIAVLYERLGEDKLADKHYRKALRLSPKDPMAQNNYGTYLCRSGRYQESLGHFRKAAEDPLYDFPELALSNAAMCANLIPDHDKARELLSMALEIDAEFPPALIQMALVNYNAGDYFRARAFLERYLGLVKANPGSLWLGVRIEEKMDNQSAMLNYANTLKGQYPDSEQTRELLEWENERRTRQ